MRTEIVEENVAALPDYACVPIAFEVRQMLDIEPSSTAGSDFRLRERELATPIRKDYDAIMGNGPTDWPARFDLSNWASYQHGWATDVLKAL